MGMSDRILMLREGRVAGEFAAARPRRRFCWRRRWGRSRHDDEERAARALPRHRPGPDLGAFTLLSPAFLSPRNLSMLVIELSTTALLALGMLLVILPGHIDLSVGSGVGLIGGVASVLVFHHGWPAPAAMLLGFLLAVAVWTAMGAIIVKQRMRPSSSRSAGCSSSRGSSGS